MVGRGIRRGGDGVERGFDAAGDRGQIEDAAAFDAGLRSVARIRKTTRSLQGQTLLLDPQPQVRKVFDIVKAVPVNEVFTSTQELDAYLDRMQRQITEGDDDA